MAAARRLYCSDIVLTSMLNNLPTDFHKLIGRTPWTGIAENPSAYIAKKSRADTDHQLQEPSHMKSDGVDAWLQHWLKFQKRNKRPLVLKDMSDAIQSNPTTTSKGKGKAKAPKAPSIDDDNSDDEADEVHTNPTTAPKVKAKAPKAPSIDDGNSDDNAVDEDSNNNHSTTDANRLLPTPLSASETRKTRREFLATLSDDPKYQQSLLLLRAAKVRHIISSIEQSNDYAGRRPSGGESTCMGLLEI